MPLEELAPPPPDPDDELAEAERRRCATERAKAHLAVEGATVRAGLYTPPIIATLAVGATGKMLSDIMNGQIQVRHAKDAIDVAKIALDIAKTDWSEVIPGADDGTNSREQLINRAADVVASIRLRAKNDVAANAGDEDVDLSEFDLDDEGAAPPRLRSVPSTA